MVKKTTNQVELQEFIQGALVQIIKGAHDAREQIYAETKHDIQYFGSVSVKDQIERSSSRLEFDIEISTTKSKGAKGKGAVTIPALFVVSGEIGADGHRESTDYQGQRIKFSVPFIFPANLSSTK